MRTIILFAAILSGLLFSLSSCYHIPSLPENALPADSIVCFQNDVLPVIQTNCGKTGCHAGGRGLNLSDYNGIIREVDVSDPIKSKFITAIYDRRMPPYPNIPLSQNQIDLIYTWIQQGAHNNTCNEICDTTNVTFSGGVQAILSTYCIGCHTGVTAGTTINLTNYQGVYQTVTSERLIGCIEQLPGYYAMPQGGSKLSDCQITTIQKWVSAGAPDN